MKKIVAAFTAAALLSGCATAVRGPNAGYSLVDPARTDMNRYTRDYRDCEALANQADVGASALGGAGAGAVVGALLGGAIGAIACGRGCAQQGAALLAVTGGASGAGDAGGRAYYDQQQTLRRCLSNRGYELIR